MLPTRHAGFLRIGGGGCAGEAECTISAQSKPQQTGLPDGAWSAPWLRLPQSLWFLWLSASSALRHGSGRKNSFVCFTKTVPRSSLDFPAAMPPWTEEEKAHAMEVSRKMNTVAYLMNFLPRREALEHWDDPLAKAWVVLKPIVLEERKRARWNSKWKHFEVWGDRALKKLIREQRDPTRQEVG